MKTEWTGTPAEWDAERDRRAGAILTESACVTHPEALRWATATMPPRSAEPPSVVTASGWRVTWDGTVFVYRYQTRVFSDSFAHKAAAYIDATEAEHDAIRALRGGPTPRYEVCGWQVRRGLSEVTTWSIASLFTADQCKELAEKNAGNFGGTAHPIFRRVDEGAK